MSLRNTIRLAHRLAFLLFLSCLISPFATAQTLAVDNDIETYATLTSTTVTITGRSELRITGTGTPLTGCTINLNSTDSWLIFTNIKPSVVNTTAYRNQIKVSGAAAVLNTNCRIVQYGNGTVVIPQGSGFAPMQVFTGALFTGSSMSLTNYTDYNSTTLGTFNDKISSFKLKRGYTATIAQNTNGTGISKNYVAQDGDIEVSLLPSSLNDSVSFVRVFPWRWVTKKGSGDVDPTLLNAKWHYDWNIDKNSGLDWEYVAIKQQPNWPSLSQNWQTRGVNHLLGLNEPNNPVEDSYKNLSPVGSTADAVARMTDLLATGLRLGGPAVTDGGYSWIVDFVNKADAAGYRLDYIPVHYYRSTSGNDPQTAANNMYNFIKGIHDATGGRPIWVTEFNNGADWTDNAQDPTANQNKNVIEAMINMMDDTSWIERYSIYSHVEWFRQTHYNDGTITPMGAMYRDHVAPMAYQQVMPSVSTPAGAFYRFENDTRDSSANGHTAMTKGAATFTTGKTGQAIVMSGSSSSADHVVLPPRLGDSADFTFGAWVYWAGGASWQRIFDLGTGTSNYMYLTPSASTGVLRFGIRDGGDDQQLNHTAALPINTWTHVAVTISGNTGKLFVDGVLVDTNTSMTLNPSDLGTTSNYLGKSHFSTDPYFAGRLDDVQFLPTALGDAAVARMMSNTPPQFASGTITGPAGSQDTPYIGSIAGAATDADAGDTITYSKYSGPAWLTVAADGTLSGTPPGTSEGPQEFIVFATDLAGASAATLLNIQLPVVLGNGTWTSNSSGTWSDKTKWSSNFPANGPGYSANFSTLNLAANTTVTLDRTRTIGTMTFGDTSGTESWTLNSADDSKLNLAVTSGSPSIVVSQNTATLALGVSGTNGFTKTGIGTLVLNGDNSLSGTVILGGAGATSANDGTVRIAHPEAISAVGTINIISNSGASAASTLEFDGTGGDITATSAIALSGRNASVTAIRNLSGNNTLAGALTLNTGGSNYIFESVGGLLTHSGNITSTVGGTRTLNFQGGGNTEVSGRILNGTSTVLAVTKSGTGTITLSGANTYTGVTTVSAGKLAVNGSIVSGGALTVASGAVLTGGGTIATAATINGTHNPGAGFGTQTFTGSLNYGTASRLSWELGDNSLTPASFDRVAGGTVNIGSGASLDAVFNAPGTAVNFTDPFWLYPLKWTLLNGTNITGSFMLATVSQDSGGRSIFSYGTLALQQSATAVTLVFTPSGSVPAPLVPAGVTTTSSDGQVNLTWNETAGADTYNVLRSTSSEGPFTTIASGLTTPAYSDFAATNGTTYFYVLTATNSAGTGLASTAVEATPVPVYPQDFVHGNLIQFNNNGGWCWFQDERAIIDFTTGNLLVSSITDSPGYNARASDVDVASYNISTGARSIFTLGNFGTGGSDDHNSGALLRRPDGKYLAVWSSHGADTLTRYRISNNPSDASSWAAMQTFDNADPGPGATYANIFYLPNGGTPLTYNFSRTDGYDPNFSTSTDFGATWTYSGHLAKDPASGTGGAYRPYVKYASNGSNRVYFITTEAHPSQFATSTGIYAGYVQDKAMYKMDGTLVRAAGASMNVASAPYATDYTTVFSPDAVVDGTARNRSWTTDLEVDADGNPYGVFTSRVANSVDDHRFYYTRWNGTAWEVHELAKAGGYLYSTAEPDYTGLAAVNPKDPNELYISTNIAPVSEEATAFYEIYKGITSDRGATWTWTPVTRNSTMDNIRPIMPAGDDSVKAVLWLRGTYTTYVDFHLAVVGLVEHIGSNPPSTTQYIDATPANTVPVAGGAWLSGTGTGMGPNDSLWFSRTGYGNGGSILSADEGAAESAPLLKTSVTGLAPDDYDVYAFFWSDIDELWQIQAGFSSTSLLGFEKLGAQQVLRSSLTGATTVGSATGHYMYKVYLGRTKVTGDTLSVYVKDGIGSLAGRTWYDGIGYAIAPDETPTLSAIPDQTLQFNTASSPIALTVGDSDSPLDSLTLSGSATNPALIPSGNIIFSGTGSSRTAVITPAAGMSGTTSVTFVVSDGTETRSQTFNVTVFNQSDTWRLQNFGTNWGNDAIAGSLADPDADGLLNLIEYAIGSNPNGPTPEARPQAVKADGKFSITFKRQTTATDVTLCVQAAESPAGPWIDIASSTAGAAFIATAPDATVEETGTGSTRDVRVSDIYLLNQPSHPARFMRLQVNRPLN
ncbi:MAG: LamG-like jellyroll fold domain-containing protein [Luteolibacter sp.]